MSDHDRATSATAARRRTVIDNTRSARAVPGMRSSFRNGRLSTAHYRHFASCRLLRSEATAARWSERGVVEDAGHGLVG